MKERPIIFSGPMIRAILDGTKSQSRRVIKPQPYKLEDQPVWVYPSPKSPYVRVSWFSEEHMRRGLLGYCPFSVGQRLWVRETWTAVDDDYQGSGDTCSNAEILYRADGRTLWRNIPEARRPEWFAKLTPLIARTSRLWRPSIFMPKFAARIWLEVVSVRAEQLQDITEDDIRAEGILPDMVDSGAVDPNGGWDIDVADYYHPFMALWDRLNAKRGYGWDTNPWVFAVEFTVA